ncbi:hypothetical protein [Limisphaera sp. 4302-co]|uniref:hypothetical protein n=1 Tax=Limisphaera sp. 4302-co TaxID=3400417 RepID=UPI003C1C273C
MSPEEAAALVARIKEAFPNEPVPGPDEILNPDVSYIYGEDEESKSTLARRKWTSLTLQEIFHIREWLALLSPRAFTYYAPAWMVCYVLDPDGLDTGLCSILMGLKYGDIGMRTPEQVQVVCDWLTWVYRVRGTRSLEELEPIAKRLGCPYLG